MEILAIIVRVCGLILVAHLSDVTQAQRECIYVPDKKLKTQSHETARRFQLSTMSLS